MPGTATRPTPDIDGQRNLAVQPRTVTYRRLTASRDTLPVTSNKDLRQNWIVQRSPSVMSR